MPTAERNNRPRRLRPGRGAMSHRWMARLAVVAVFAASVVGCSRAPHRDDVPFEQPGTPVAARQSFCNGYLTRGYVTSVLGDLHLVTEWNRFPPGIMVGECSFYDQNGLVLRVYGDYLISDDAIREVRSWDASQSGALVDGEAVAYPAPDGAVAHVALPQGGQAEVFVPKRGGGSQELLRATLRVASLFPAVHVRKLKVASASASGSTPTTGPRP
jgi:hypothetical protein